MLDRFVAVGASKTLQHGALPKKSGLAQSAKRTSENSPALQCWVSSPGRPQSVKRTTDKSSTAPTFWAKPQHRSPQFKLWPLFRLLNIGGHKPARNRSKPRKRQIELR